MLGNGCCVMLRVATQCYAFVILYDVTQRCTFSATLFCIMLPKVMQWVLRNVTQCYVIAVTSFFVILPAGVM